MAHRVLIERQDPITRQMSVAKAIDEKGRDVTKLMRQMQDVKTQEITVVWPTEKEIKEAEEVKPIDPIGVEKG
jgi:hypothetical protein